jgi:hypothetical protein
LQDTAKISSSLEEQSENLYPMFQQLAGSTDDERHTSVIKLYFVKHNNKLLAK